MKSSKRKQHGTKPVRLPDRRARMQQLPPAYRQALEQTFSECGLGGDLSLRGQHHD